MSDQVIDFLERIYPGLRPDIEVVDEATPFSYERYTGNWQGSSTGWLLTTQTMTMNIVGMPKTLPGLADFYMCGQWVQPGGMVPVCAMFRTQRDLAPLPRRSTAVCDRVALSAPRSGLALRHRGVLSETGQSGGP